MFPQEFQHKFAKLRRHFLSGLPAREAELEELTAELLEHGASEDVMQSLQLAAHKLAGICATYGLYTLGEKAVSVETQIDAVQPALPTAAELERILVAADILAEALSAVIAGEGPDQPAFATIARN